MSTRMLELLREISEAQLNALRNRDFYALSLLHESRQELMLQIEIGAAERGSDNSSRIQSLLDEIFENEKHMRMECPVASAGGMDPAWI